jgi:transposase
MREDFLTTALGLQGFCVTAMRMSGDWIDLDLDREDGGEYVCGRCGQVHLVAHDAYAIHPRDLPICGKHVRLHLRRHRVFCSCCDKVVNEHLPYIRPNAHMTIRFEQALHAECAETPVEAVARRHDLSWSTVRDVDLRILREKVAAQSLAGLRWIAVDEIAHRKGHKYLTVVTDLKRRRIVRLYEDRKASSLRAFFQELGPAGRALIECVVIDMWKPYRQAIRRRLPNARVIIDKFHVVKAVHEALDRVRKDQQAALPDEERKRLKGARWLLLRSLENTAKKGKSDSLADLLALNETLAKAYLLKEEFRQWYGSQPGRDEGDKAFLDRIGKELRRWYRHVHESGLAAFEAVVGTIKRWRGPILNYFLTRLTNGLSEALNNVIKTIKKRAYGYRNKEYFSLKIYQKVGLI